MITKDVIDSLLSTYDKNKINIATYCSHSALNIFHGAKKEKFKTLGIGQPKELPFYEAFQAARPDAYLPVEEPKDMLKLENQKFLIKYNAIVIPHGSFVEYVGAKNLEEKFKVPMQGNRKVLAWESDREKQKHWLREAGIKTPQEFASPDEIDRLCIVKFHGAKGGQDFFFSRSSNEFYGEMKRRKKDPEETKITIQEYILGSRFYPHMHFSPFSEKGLKINDGWLEILGYDQRMESNIDELHRAGLFRKEMRELGIAESFTVVGNRPVIPREKLQAKYFSIGKQIVEASQKLFPPGMLGPFCPETICTKDLDIYTFEISARIVAGTSMWSPQGAPEGWYTWGEPMPMGRRIAREIKMGIEKGELEKVIY